MTVLVALAPHKEDRATLELASTLARGLAESVETVTVVPAPWPTPIAGAADRDFAEWSRSRGEAAVARATELAAEVCPDIEVTAGWRAGRSVASTLHEAAEQSAPTMLVVGSSSRGSSADEGEPGHIRVSSVADRLVHSSPVPVLVAPPGYRTPAGGRTTRVSFAYREGERTQEVLARIAAEAEKAEGELRLLTFAIRGRTMFPPEVGPAEVQVQQQWIDQATAALERARGALLADGLIAPERLSEQVVPGRTWEEAMAAADVRDDEILVLCAVTAGRVRRVFLGSNGSKILRLATVPVLVTH